MGARFFSGTARCAVPKKIKIARGRERALVRAGNLLSVRSDSVASAT